ncbi:unnamed protein product [Lampetra fluviatilis]
MARSSGLARRGRASCCNSFSFVRNASAKRSGRSRPVREASCFKRRTSHSNVSLLFFFYHAAPSGSENLDPPIPAPDEKRLKSDGVLERHRDNNHRGKFSRAVAWQAVAAVSLSACVLARYKHGTLGRFPLAR